MIAFKLVYLPIKERAECVHEFGRPVAEEIASRVSDAPLYSFGLDDEKDAPVLFYLHRDVAAVRDSLADAPTGYTIALEKTWLAERDSAQDFEKVLGAGPDSRRFALLRRMHDGRH